MELGSVHEHINMSLPLAHSSLHHLEFMSQYGLLCISAELELGIIRVNIFWDITHICIYTKYYCPQSVKLTASNI